MTDNSKSLLLHQAGHTELMFFRSSYICFGIFFYNFPYVKIRGKEEKQDSV